MTPSPLYEGSRNAGGEPCADRTDVPELSSTFHISNVGPLIHELPKKIDGQYTPMVNKHTHYTVP